MVGFSKKWYDGNEVIAPREVILPSYATGDLPDDAKDGTIAHDTTLKCIAIRLNTEWVCLGGFANNYSMLMDGSNESIHIDGAITPLASTTKGTISLWVKPVDSTPSGTEVMLSFGDTNANSAILMIVTPAGKLQTFYQRFSAVPWNIITDNKVFTDDTWTHIAVVQDAIFPVLYVNGVAVDQESISPVDGTVWFNDNTGLDNGRIGCISYNSAGDSNNYEGNIDNVSLFNTNLTATEILEIYNLGTPINLLAHSKSANLIGWWQMGEGGTYSGGVWTIPDDSVNSNNGTSVNMEVGDRVSDTP